MIDSNRLRLVRILIYVSMVVGSGYAYLSEIYRVGVKPSLIALLICTLIFCVIFIEVIFRLMVKRLKEKNKI